MKRFLIIFLMSASINATSQTYILNTETRKINSVDYQIEYLSNNYIAVYNTFNPFSGIMNGSEWQSEISFKFNNEIYDIIGKYLVPHLKNKNISSDDDMFYMRVFYDLSGVLKFTDFIFSSNLGLSFETIAELESALKKESRLILKYDPARVKDIHYINITLTPSLSALIRDYEPPREPPGLDRPLEFPELIP